MDAFNKRLRDEIVSLRKSIDAIRYEYERENENRRQQTPQPVVVRAELQVPEGTERDRGARNDRAHRQQVWLTVGTWLAFGAAVIYAGIAAKQLKQMRIATQAATSAANTASSQFEFTLRQTEDSEEAHVQVAPNYFTGNTVTFRVQNSGKRFARVVNGNFTITRQWRATGVLIGNAVPEPIYIGELRDMTDYMVEVPGLLDSSNAIKEGKQTVIIQGQFSYDNGFGRIITEKLCAETVPVGIPKATTFSFVTCDQSGSNFRNDQRARDVWKKAHPGN
jgi:hypothetical protein